MDNRLDIDRSSYNVRAYGPRPVNGSLNGHYHPAESVKPSSGLSIIALEAFMTQQLAPREMVLDPIIAVRSLCLLFAYRGIGKTMVAFNIAWAIACGGRFLRWSSPKPRRVLYVDGEMPQQLLQERARTMIEGSNVRPPAPDFFRLLSLDRQELGVSINLARREHQVEIEKLLDTGIEFIVFEIADRLDGRVPQAISVDREERIKLIAVVPQKASSTEEWLKLVEGEQRAIEHQPTDLESTE